MSFIQFFRILWARRAIVLLSTIGCFIAAALVIASVPPRYSAGSRLMLDLLKPDPVTGDMIGSRSAREFVKTQMQLIQDYRVAGKVVDALGWANSPALAARYAERAPSDNRDFRRWLAQTIMNNTSVNWVENSNILAISYTSTSPEAAAKTADAVRQAYVEHTLDFKRESAARNAAWFGQQTEKLRNQLAAAEKRKTDFERENGIVLQEDNSDPEMAKLKALAQNVPVAQAAVGTFVAPSSAQLSMIDAQIAASSRTLGPNHPDIRNLKEQRAAVEAAVARETAAARSNSVMGGPSAASLLSAQTRKVLAQRGKVGEAQRLATDVQVLRNQFDKAAAKTADYEQQAQTMEAGITLLGSAVAPSEPEFPKVGLIMTGAIGMGFALGILTSLIIELLSRRVRAPEDLANSGLPVIGAMGRAPGDDADEGLLWKWLGIRLPLWKRATQ
ncbi:MAG: chain length determinant protein [Sphingobium sp.]